MGTDWNKMIAGEEVTDAVITVPAYFNDAQRQATKVDVKCSAKVTKIEDTKVVYEMNGETCEVSYDKVVLAVGYKPNTTFVESLKDNFDYEMLDVIGDANKADKVLTAVHQGYHAARNIE